LVAIGIVLGGIVDGIIGNSWEGHLVLMLFLVPILLSVFPPLFTSSTSYKAQDATGKGSLTGTAGINVTESAQIRRDLEPVIRVRDERAGRAPQTGAGQGN
jgi:hypothetical protein